ncbi:MAG: hypothetical protein ACK526_03365 [Planctomyces sp.]
MNDKLLRNLPLLLVAVLVTVVSILRHESGDVDQTVAARYQMRNHSLMSRAPSHSIRSGSSRSQMQNPRYHHQPMDIPHNNTIGPNGPKQQSRIVRTPSNGTRL